MRSEEEIRWENIRELEERKYANFLNILVMIKIKLCIVIINPIYKQFKKCNGNKVLVPKEIKY